MKLHSVSIGKDEQRRTMVYFASHSEFANSNMSKDGEDCSESKMPSSTSTSNKLAANPVPIDSVKSAKVIPTVQKNRNRRPDMQLYVPKAKRQGDDKREKTSIDPPCLLQQTETVKSKKEICRPPIVVKRKLKSQQEKRTLSPSSAPAVAKEQTSKIPSVIDQSSDVSEATKNVAVQMKTSTSPDMHIHHSEVLNERLHNAVQPHRCADAPCALEMSKSSHCPLGLLSSSQCKPNQTSVTNCGTCNLSQDNNCTANFMHDRTIVESFITDQKYNSAVTMVDRHLEDQHTTLEDRCSDKMQESALWAEDCNISSPSLNSATTIHSSNRDQACLKDSSLCNNSDFVNENICNGDASHVVHTSIDDHLDTAEQNVDQNVCKKDQDSHSRQLTVLDEKGSVDVVSASDSVCATKTLGNAGSCQKQVVKLKTRKMSTEDQGSWDAIYDDNGECLDASLVEQLVAVVGDVEIDTPYIDYLAFQTVEPQLSDEDFGHIVEIYDFPVEFKTEDLISAFSSFKDRGFNIKWVNDTHALAVFSSRLAAEEALLLQHPIIKTRPLSQGIKESKLKARRCAEFLQPYKPRPETSAYLARRLVAGALGMHLPVSPKQRAADRKKLLEAKERKLLAAKQREEAWEGIPGN